MKVNILGSHYDIKEKSADKDARLNDCDGYCDWTIHAIVIRRERDGNLNDMDEYIKKVKRHEIVHAFMFECGLAHSSFSTDAWAVNEEMVDWIAWNGAKIYKAWQDANAL